VFDTLETALKLANFMRMCKQWTVAALAHGGVKMIAPLQNQKLLMSFVPVYVSDEHHPVRAPQHVVHCQSDGGATERGLLRQERDALPRQPIAAPGRHERLVDWNYQASPADDAQGSQLHDCAPLLFDFTA
jgi:hypothetical protein